MIRRIFPLLTFLLLCSPASRAANFQTLLPRPPVLPGNADRLPEKTEIGSIVIKFQESSQREGHHHGDDRRDTARSNCHTPCSPFQPVSAYTLSVCSF
jgi:hypothetical protein